jgi:hypothetical protein
MSLGIILLIILIPVLLDVFPSGTAGFDGE